MDYSVLRENNMICLPKRNNRVIRFFQPLRIITIITLLALIPTLNLPPESATLFMYGFFLIYGASYVFEARFHPNGLIAGFKELRFKYIQKLPIEFAAIAVFAISSFSPNNNDVIHYGILTASIVIGCGLVIDAYHKYAAPKLNRMRVSDRTQIIAFIGAVVLFVGVWNYSFFQALEHLK